MYFGKLTVDNSNSVTHHHHLSVTWLFRASCSVRMFGPFYGYRVVVCGINCTSLDYIICIICFFCFIYQRWGSMKLRIHSRDRDEVRGTKRESQWQSEKVSIISHLSASLLRFDSKLKWNASSQFNANAQNTTATRRTRVLIRLTQVTILQTSPLLNWFSLFTPSIG